MLLSILPTRGQSVEMVNGDTLFLDACSNAGVTIYDDGGESGDYSNSFDGWVVVESDAMIEINLSGDYNTESGYDKISVWDGDTRVESERSGTGTLNVNCTTGRLTLYFHSDGTVTRSGFALTLNVAGFTVPDGISELRTTAVGATTAALAWTSTNSGPFHVVLNDTEAGTTAATSYTLTGLQSASRYHVRVYATGHEDNPCAQGRLTFRTACGSKEMPLTEDFQDMTVGVVPHCWTRSVNFDDTVTMPRVVEPSSGNRAAMLSCGNNSTVGHYGMLLTPTIRSTATEWTIDFDYRVSHSNTCIRIGVCDSVSPEYQYYGFTTLQTLTTSSNTQWQHFHWQGPVPTGSAHVAFQMVQSDQGGGVGKMAYIDNLAVTTCGISTSRTLHTDTTSTIVEWTTYGNPSVDVDVRRQGTPTVIQTHVAATSPLSLTGLTPGTTYAISLTPRCDGRQQIPVELTVTTQPVADIDSTICTSLSYNHNGNYQLADGWTFVTSTNNTIGAYANYITLSQDDYIVSPPLGRLGGKQVIFSVATPRSSPNPTDAIEVGTSPYADDMSGYTPFATLPVQNYNTAYHTVTIPAGRTDQFLVFHSPSTSYNIKLYSVSVQHCAVENPRIVGASSHSVNLSWDGPADDTVIVMYYNSTYPDATLSRTFVNTTTATIDGLNTITSYTFLPYRPCGDTCGATKLVQTTKARDFDLPICEDFETWTPNTWKSGEWYYKDRSYGMPDVTSIHSHSGHNAMQLASASAISASPSRWIFPPLQGVAGQTMSFWAFSMAPSSQLVVSSYNAFGTSYNGDYDFHPFDTIDIDGGGVWHHYAITLPDTMTGQIALHYVYAVDGGMYYLWVDDLQIGAAGYAGFTFANIDAHEVDVVWHAEGADHAAVRLEGANGDTHMAVGTPDTIHIDGLDSNTTYICYIAPIVGTDTLCWSYAGRFLTPLHSAHGDGLGDGILLCNTMDDLLSYELPGGWIFSDSGACAVAAGVGVEGSDALRIALDAPLASTTIHLPHIRTLALYMAARGLGDNDTLFAGTDTLVLSSQTWQYLSIESPVESGLTMRVATGSPHGGCLIDNVGFSNCPIVDFEAKGNSLQCSVRGGHDIEYLLTLTDPQGEERNYHITGSEFTIEELPTSTTFTATWQCFYLDDGCLPTATVRTAATALPYCVSSMASLPEGFRVVATPSLASHYPLPSYYYFYNSPSSNWIYLIFPEAEQRNSLSAFLSYSSRSADVQFGVLTNPVDTGSFVAANTHIYKGDVYAADLSNLPHGNVALRIGSGSLHLTGLQLLPTPLVSIHLYRPDTLTAERESNGDYWMDCSDNLTTSRLVHVDTDSYDIPLGTSYRQWTIQILSDSAATPCSRELSFYHLSPIAPPYCSDNDYDLSNHFGSITKYGSINTLNTSSNTDYGRYLYFNTTSDTVYIAFPYIDTDSLNRVHSAIDCRVSNNGSVYTQHVVLGVMTDLLDRNTFVAVDTLLFSADNQMHRLQFSPSAYQGSGKWIALKFLYEGVSTPVYIKNVHIEGCPPAMTATAGLERHNTVRIDNPSDEDFYVEYGPQGFARGNGTTLHVDHVPYFLTLTPETAYDFYFHCSLPGASCAEVHSVTTLGEPLTVPMCVDFDTCASGSIPRSWTRVGATSAGGRSAVSDSISRSGSNALVVAGTVATPDIDVDSLKQIAIGLWVMASDGDSRLQVGTMTDPTDEASFHVAKTISPRSVGVWEHHYIGFANAPGNAHFIALRNSAGSMRTLFVDDLHITNCAAFDLHIDHVDNNSIDFSWQEVGEPTVTMTVDDNGTATDFTLSGGHGSLPVSPFHNYSFAMHTQCSTALPCAEPYDDTIHLVGPAEGVGCVNPTDLSSPQSIFFSGSYVNPYSEAGAVDFGSRSADSRHTVCYDTTERDPRTGGLLRTIPEGYFSSVRLGNWSTSMEQPQAEGVVYSLMVDTLNFNMLMMRYAAVLQDPMHDASDQPRFRLELLDSAFNLIDPLCAAADFIANRNLGWNEADNNVLWKDWTAVGIDLSDYAGQQVYVRLTTYDCNEGSHYGYAYFTLECMRKSIEAETCGDADSNRFSAPAGFAYRWHTSTSNATLGTGQTLTVPTSTRATYLCDLSFVGNSTCSFTLKAYGGPRYPLALFDTAVSPADCGFNVQFVNLSTISSDGITPTGTGEGCQSAFWDFGNGQTSTNYHGATTYDSACTYLVTLIATISGGCTDTLLFPLTLKSPSLTGPDEICAGATATLTLVDGTTADTLWNGNRLSVATTLADTAAPIVVEVDALGPDGCLHHLQHTLLVHPLPQVLDTVMLCEAMFPYQWNGQFLVPPPSTRPLADTVGFDATALLTTTHGCDSTVLLHLASTPRPTITHKADTAVISGSTVYLWAEGADSIDWRLSDGSLLASSSSVSVNPDHTTTYLIEARWRQPGCAVVDSVTVTALCGHDYDSTVCRNTIPFQWNDTVLADTGTYTRVFASPSCLDSVVRMHLTIADSYDIFFSDTLLQNALATYTPPLALDLDLTARIEALATDSDAPVLLCVVDTAVTLASVDGCDSTVHFRLNAYRNYHVTDSVARCDNRLPYLWRGNTYEAPTDTTVILTTVHGADSAVHFILAVDATYDVADTIVICPSGQWIYEGMDYGGPTEFDSPHLTAHDCDSLVHVVLRPRDGSVRLAPVVSIDGSPWMIFDTTLLDCRATELRLLDTAASTARQWSLWPADTPGDTLVGSDSLFTATLDTTGIFSFQLIAVDHNNCYDTVHRDSLLWIFHNPEAEFFWSPDHLSMHRPEAQFYNRSMPDGLSYTWLFPRDAAASAFDTAFDAEPFYAWEAGIEPGDYPVSLVAHWLHHGPDGLSLVCTDTATTPITIVNTYLQFPNVVTPNGDGINDRWEVVNLLEMGEYSMNELWIYDRWGHLVYHAKNIRQPSDFWDPEATQSPDGTYYFRFSAKSLFGIVKQNGAIEVVR